MNWSRAAIACVLIASAFAAPQAGGQQASGVPPMTRIQLDYGIEVSIPQGWIVQDAASNRQMTASGVAVMNLAGIPVGRGGLLLAASPDGNTNRVSVLISLMRRPSASQAQVAGLTGPRLDQVNAQFKDDLENGLRVEGATMVNWGGSSKTRLGSLYSLVSRYTYSMPEHGTRVMESHRIFLGGGSIGLLLQAPLGEADKYVAAFSAIKNSFRATSLD